MRVHRFASWIIPHKGNHFHPHAIRPIGLSAVLLIILATNVSYNYTTGKTFQVLGYATSVSASEIIALSNQERVNNGLPALHTSAALNQAAAAKAQHMFANNYWAHVAPDGTTPWYFFTQAGYQYVAAGENLAKDFNTSAGVVNGWMGSSGHRANILNTSFVDTGVAAVNGTLLGQETTLVVAMYGATAGGASPSPAAPPPAAPTPTPSPPATPATGTTQKAATPSPTTSSPPSSAPSAAPQSAPAAPPPVPSQSEQPAMPTPSGTEAAEKLMQVVDTSAAGAGTLGAETAMSIRQQMNWAQKVAVFMLSIVLFVTVLKHTVVWRTQRRGLRHIWMRAHPAAQYICIVLAIVANIATGVGVIK